MKKIKNIKNNFIIKIIDRDLSLNKNLKIHTRFPPEPNGYLHIGHAKSICLNFYIAKYYNGYCNLRIDDTNPNKENIKYVDSIKYDIKWLGFDWFDCVRYASNYFDKCYYYAIELIEKNLAYVDQLSQLDLHNYRGTLTKPGKNSPYRNRKIKDNINLFEKMRDGKFTEGSACLRAKIDMNSPFMVLRDPVIYRIKFAKHHQTGNNWCIYPTYDFAHCISDAIEGISHSLCTLEFLDNRRLYNWILNNITINRYPKQYEFSKLDLEYTILSKRKLKYLVDNKIVNGWDDPRMPTISGLRCRGYTANAIRNFCSIIGVTRQNSKIKMSMLESCLQNDLNKNAPRIMAVINPLLVIIYSLPMNYKKNLIALNHPNRLDMGTRNVILSREIYIDSSDFCENPSEQYKRLSLGKKIRLRNAFIIKAEYIKRDSKNKIIAIFCSHDPRSLNKNPTNKSDIPNVIHWVSAKHNVQAEFRLYENLFSVKNPHDHKDLLSLINPNSLNIYHGFIELSFLYRKNNRHFQFEREGYFYLDNYNFSYPVFNRIIKLNSFRFKK